MCERFNHTDLNVDTMRYPPNGPQTIIALKSQTKIGSAKCFLEITQITGTFPRRGGEEAAQCLNDTEFGQKKKNSTSNKKKTSPSLHQLATFHRLKLTLSDRVETEGKKRSTFYRVRALAIHIKYFHRMTQFVESRKTETSHRNRRRWGTPAPSLNGQGSN